MKYLVELLLLALWLAGIVLVKGFWLTIAAVFFPPYAWYTMVERALVAMGWVGA